jgi:hypothetical protein
LKAIIAGGRDFIDDVNHKKWLIDIIIKEDINEIVCGMARGADMYGYKVGKELGLSIKEFPALWDKYGKSAGYRRNVEMANYADICILIPGGKGTKHMENIAREKKLLIFKWGEN